jgi:pyridinium-3,5-biscarboxylic acid mononucleotide synthase
MSNNFNLDFDRNQRLGFPETVFGANKSAESLLNIARALVEKHEHALITRMQEEKFLEISRHFDRIQYDKASGACLIGKIAEEPVNKSVAILSGGTSDEFIVNEAYYTLRYLGIGATRFQDIGIAGLHRLLSIKDELAGYRVLIVVAGFEGALPTVVGGLSPLPIIAVPASIGYGVAKDGFTALNAMLSSCANGIVVVNIDNGYGAALAAYRIINNGH